MKDKQNNIFSNSYRYLCVQTNISLITKILVTIEEKSFVDLSSNTTAKVVALYLLLTSKTRIEGVC